MTVATSSKRSNETNTKGIRVMLESYPSGNGCYQGQDLDDDYIEARTETKTIGVYDTLEEAVEKEKKNVIRFVSLMNGTHAYTHTPMHEFALST